MGACISGLSSSAHLPHGLKDNTASLTCRSKSCHGVIAGALGRGLDGIEFNNWFPLLLVGWSCTCFVIPLNFSFLICKVGDGINTHLLYKSWL